jgi:hypothetical protein
VNLSPDQRIVDDSGEIVKQIAETLSNKQSFPKQAQDQFCAQLIEIVTENAKKLIAEEGGSKVDERGSKFEMGGDTNAKEATLGDVKNFFDGLPKLIGSPSPNLVK